MFKQKRFLIAILSALLVVLLNGSNHLTLAQSPSGEEASPEAVQQEAAPTSEATTAPTSEATTAPTSEATTAPTSEATTAPTSEATTAPTSEATTAPTSEATTAPTSEATTAPTSEATVEATATVTPTEEATVEATATVTPTEEATVEATATVTPTIEATATITPTAEITATATVTPTVEVGTEGVSGQMYSGTWQSGIGVKNLTTSDNTISIEFYNATTGTKQSYTYGATLASQAGIELYLPNVSDSNLSSGSYAAKVIASGAVGVSTTATNYSANMADSYNGMSASTEFFVPGIYNNYNSWGSELFVQNTDSSAINVYIQVSGKNLSTQAAVGPFTFGPLTIPAYATSSFDFTNSTFAYDANLGDNFLGSAKVTNSEGKPMAAVLFNTRVSGTNQVTLSYRGMTTAGDADTFLAAPVIYKNYGGGWRTGINVQNVDSSDPVDARLTVKSKDGSVTATSTQTIQPGKSYEWFLPSVTFDGGVTLADGFIGSAKVEVTDSGSGTIVGTVTSTNYNKTKSLSTSPAGVGVALGYIMPSRVGGKATLSAPTVYKGFGTGVWNSSLVVSNVGTDSVDFSLKFTSDSDSPASYSNTISGFSLAAGESKEFYLPDASQLNGNTIPTGFKGSIYVSATSSGTAKVAGIVQHANYGRGVATVYLTPGN